MRDDPSFCSLCIKNVLRLSELAERNINMATKSVDRAYFKKFVEKTIKRYVYFGAKIFKNSCV